MAARLPGGRPLGQGPSYRRSPGEGMTGTVWFFPETTGLTQSRCLEGVHQGKIGLHVHASFTAFQRHYCTRLGIIRSGKKPLLNLLIQRMFIEQLCLSGKVSLVCGSKETNTCRSTKRRNYSDWDFSRQQVCLRSEPRSTWKHSPAENTAVSTSS